MGFSGVPKVSHESIADPERVHEGAYEANSEKKDLLPDHIPKVVHRATVKKQRDNADASPQSYAEPQRSALPHINAFLQPSLELRGLANLLSRLLPGARV